MMFYFAASWWTQDWLEWREIMRPIKSNSDWKWLIVSTPLQLLMCVVFALYGKAEGVRILRKAYGNSLDELINDMHFAFPAKAAISQPPKSATKKKSKKTTKKRR
jgi:hypothetical protein